MPQTGPLLVRMIYNAQYTAAGAYTLPPAEVAANLDEMVPCDVIGFGIAQYTSFAIEEIIDELRKRGRMIMRSASPTMVRQAHAAKPYPNFDRQLHDQFISKGYILRDGAGEPLLSRWYGQQLIIRWDLISEEEILDFVSHFAFVRGDVWWIDVWVETLRPWILERHEEISQAQLDDLYDKEIYQERRDFFIRTLGTNIWGPETGRQIFLNGDSLRRHDKGELVFFENAVAKEWNEMFSRWRSREGCILEIRTPGVEQSLETRRVVWQRINLAVDAWLEDGDKRNSWLWVDNEWGYHGMEPTRPATHFALARQAQWRMLR